jgi:predicted nucleic acid-binding protein
MPTNRSLFVDTAGWACYIDRKDPFHKAVVEIYREARTSQRGIVTTNYVISEVLPLLMSRRDFPRQQISALIRSIRTSPHIEIVHIDPATDDEVWGMVETYSDKQWSWVDCSSFVIMRRFGMTDALTTDHHFTQAGFVRLPA